MKNTSGSVTITSMKKTMGEQGEINALLIPVILLTILFLGGIQLICMGLLGEYIGRIYDEVRRRPLYLIHKLHRSESQGMLRYKTDKVLAEVEDSVA